MDPLFWVGSEDRSLPLPHLAYQHFVITTQRATKKKGVLINTAKIPQKAHFPIGDMGSRFDLHAQLGSLLENAQYLLADSAPSSTSGYGVHGQTGYYGTGTGRHQGMHHANPPAVYSFVAMQVSLKSVSSCLWSGCCHFKYPGT